MRLGVEAIPATLGLAVTARQTIRTSNKAEMALPTVPSWRSSLIPVKRFYERPISAWKNMRRGAATFERFG